MLTKQEIKQYFRTGAAAARAIGMSRAYFHKLSDPVPVHYACQFEVATGGQLQSGFVSPKIVRRVRVVAEYGRDGGVKIDGVTYTEDEDEIEDEPGNGTAQTNIS